MRRESPSKTLPRARRGPKIATAPARQRAFGSQNLAGTYGGGSPCSRVRAPGGAECFAPRRNPRTTSGPCAGLRHHLCRTQEGWLSWPACRRVFAPRGRLGPRCHARVWALSVPCAGSGPRVGCSTIRIAAASTDALSRPAATLAFGRRSKPSSARTSSSHADAKAALAVFYNHKLPIACGKQPELKHQRTRTPRPHADKISPAELHRPRRLATCASAGLPRPTT